MTRLSLGALLLTMTAACMPAKPVGTGPKGGDAPPASQAAAMPSGPAAAPALETDRGRATERALAMIGRNDPALSARIAAAELADPLHGLPPRLREILNSLAGEGVDASQRSLLIRTAFEEDPRLRAAFDGTCRPGWTGLALGSLAEGQRPPVIAEACKSHPAARPSERPPAISLAIPFSIGMEEMMRAQHAPASELRLARALMFLE